ncbi:MAG: hypothetical protein ACUVQR_12295 [Thermogutta sp.]
MVEHQQAVVTDRTVQIAVNLCFCLILALSHGNNCPCFAAVVVVSNRCENPVQINVVRPEEQAASYQVPASGLIPIVSFAPVTVRVSLGQSSTVQDLALNRIYEIRNQKADNQESIVIQSVRIGNLRPGVWLFPNVKKLPYSVTIPVAVFVDEEQPAKQSVWEPRLRAQIAEASRFVEWFCRVRFEVVGTGTWQSDNARTGVEALLEDFRQKIPPQKARLLIGVSSQLTVPADRQFHANPRLLDSHIILPDVQGTFSPQDQLMSLIHALGHFLGAVDTVEPSSVMNPNYVATGAESQQRDYFDPLNVLIMNIVAEELIFRGVGQAGQFSTGTRDYLSAIYRFLGQRTRRRDIQLALEALEKPILPMERFIIQWRGGRQISVAEISNWGDPEGRPEASGRLLFDPNDPVRWILDTSLQDQVNSPDAWVELWAGDRLPGRVSRAIPAGIIEQEQLPAHLEVIPYTRVDWPDGPARQKVRVLTSHLKRIVWQRVVGELLPGHAFLRDGRTVSYRLIQWTTDGVRLLTNDGIQTLSFAELAELHLPAIDPWEEIMEQRVGLTPKGQGLVMQLETIDGLVATTSSERWIVRSRGDKAVPENWYHFIQPVWSLDGLWVPHRSVIWRRFYAADEVPLSVLPPENYREKSTLGGRWGYHVNRNLRSEVMATGLQVLGWGFGVPGGSEMVFPLSPLATAFQTKIALDKEAEDGGCIRAVVSVLNNTEQSVYESPLIVGSMRTFDTGTIPLATRTEGRKLILRVDEAHEDRPPAADPWNVRDLANWGEPLLTLDQVALTNFICEKGAQLIRGWHGWQLTDANKPIRVVHDLAQSSQNYPVFRWVQEFDDEFAIEQTLTIADGVEKLSVVICRPRGSQAYKAEIFADDQLLTSSVVPERPDPGLPAAIEADLSKLPKRKTRLRLVLRSESPTKDLKADWYSIQLVKNSFAKP